jgi:DNA-binding NarL/FixJ family response regulator
MEIVEAATVQEALQILETWQPQALVLDLLLPRQEGDELNLHEAHGFEIARQIKAQAPQTGLVLYSNYPTFRPEALELLAQGYGGVAYLFKGSTAPRDLCEAIRQVVAGQIIFDPQISQGAKLRTNARLHPPSLGEQERTLVEYAATQLGTLTPREREILAEVATSKTNAGIALALHITPNAVQTHLRNIYAKLGLNEVSEAFDRRALLAKTYYFTHLT